MLRAFVLIIFIVLFDISGNSQNFTIRTSSDKDTILIGEQFHFTIEVTSTTPLISFIPLDDNLFPPAIEVLTTSFDSTRLDDEWVYFAKYLITGFDSGYYLSNPIPILINTSSELDTIFSGKTSFFIISPEVDTTAAIKDLKEPLNTPFIFRELLPFAPYIAGFLVLAGLGFFGFYYFKKKKSENSASVPSLPPHVKALESLDRIKNQKLWQKGEVKEYYSQLSDTVRTYMEERFGIPAMESVTNDILNDFKTFSWDDDTLMEILEGLLQLSDLVKFAKEDPTPSDNEIHLNNAYIFIEKTKPQTQTEEAVNKI